MLNLLRYFSTISLAIPFEHNLAASSSNKLADPHNHSQNHHLFRLRPPHLVPRCHHPSRSSHALYSSTLRFPTRPHTFAPCFPSGLSLVCKESTTGCDYVEGALDSQCPHDCLDRANAMVRRHVMLCLELSSSCTLEPANRELGESVAMYHITP